MRIPSSYHCAAERFIPQRDPDGQVDKEDDEVQRRKKKKKEMIDAGPLPGSTSIAAPECINQTVKKKKRREGDGLVR